MSRPSDETLHKLGASLREISPETLQQDPDDGNIRWFLGDNGTELFVWSRDGEGPHHIQLVFARVSVEWSDKRGVVTGTFQATSSTSGGRYDAYLMQVGNVADPEVCVAAVILLEASSLTEDVKTSLINQLKATLSPMKPPDAVPQTPAPAGPMSQALDEVSPKPDSEAEPGNDSSDPKKTN